jgi:colanic acid/amylovoran biosynthesis glycosyltransferase
MKKLLDKQMRIAYLGPEIPSVSETFVYNEILELDRQGLSVVPISVHKPADTALPPQARRLAQKTSYLYDLPKNERVRNVAALFLARPKPFASTLLTAMRDAASLRAVNRASTGILYRFFAAASVARILLDKECSHIHAHFAHVPTDIAMYAALMTHIPFSFTAHANDIFVRGWLLREKVHRSAFAVTISEFNRNFLVHRGAELKKIHVVHCGVDARSFAPIKERQPRKEGTPIRIGSLGRLVEKKGFDLLVDACRLLRLQEVPFVLELVGDGPMRQELTMKTYLKGMVKDVKFLGVMDHARVAEWIRGLDLFVLACRKDRQGDMDGIPVALMEAMISGVPVVSNRVSGIPELIADKMTGWLAARADAEAFADAMQAAIQDMGPASRIIANAEAKVRKEFDLAKNVMTLAKLFQGERL